MDFIYLQVNFLPCNIVQGNGSDENTHRSQKINHKNELQEFPGTPYRFKHLSNEKETNGTDNYL